MHRICLVLLMLFAILGAETIQIGTGSLTDQNLPWEPFNFFSYTQQLYFATEIGDAGSISAISFQYQIVNPNFVISNSNISFYMGHSQRGMMDNWVPLDSLVLVAQLSLSQDNFSSSVPGSGWMTISLTNPFMYNGIDNLIIACDQNSGIGTSSSDEFLAHATPFTNALYFRSNTINPDPANPPQSGFGMRQARSNLRLEMEIEQYHPYAPNPPHNSTGVLNDYLTLSWQSNASSFDLFMGSSIATMNQIASNLSQCSYLLPQPLPLLQTFYWRVVAHHDGHTYHGDIWQFQTQGEALSPPQNLSAYFQGNTVVLSWQAPQQGTISVYEIFRNNNPLVQTEQLTYQDTNVIPGSVYVYKVRAINLLNEHSPFSNSVIVHIPHSEADLILREDFENFENFSIDLSSAGFTTIDMDSAPTWSWDFTDFPGEGNPMAWMVFNPSSCNPPLTNISAFSGNKFLISPSSLYPPNNDWLILPQVFLGNQPRLSFYAKSYTNLYGLERIRILFSTSTPEPQNFIPLHSEQFLSVPEQWTEFEIDLSQYQGLSAYIAIQCVSYDCFALLLDRISVFGTGGFVSVEEELCSPSNLRIFPNPSRGDFNISFPDKRSFELQLFDLRGRKIYAGEVIGEFNAASLKLPSGIYFCRIRDNDRLITKKVSIIRNAP